MTFFNNGTQQELTAIQGCAKKKVDILLKMRPFKGWGDLVSKIQSSKQLSTEMLNDGVALLNLQRDMVRLMEKCDKIGDTKIVFVFFYLFIQ